jgi:cell division protein ZapA
MAADTLIPLNITIGDRNYRIKILPSDEEAVRKTLKTINDKIIEFKTLYAGKDMQDYISMVLIWYATQPVQNTLSLQTEEILEALVKMDKTLEEAIKDN